MPNPKNFKNTEKGRKHFMEKCMHKTLHEEHKTKEQGQAQCLQMLRDRGKPKKHMARNVLNNFLGL